MRRSSQKLPREFSETLSFIGLLQSDESGVGIRDKRLEALRYRLLQFDASAPVTVQARLLVEMRWYAMLLAYKPFIQMIDRHMKPLLKNSLDERAPYAALLLANSPCDTEIRVISDDQTVSYSSNLKVIHAAMSQCKFGKNNELRKIVKKIGCSLENLSNMHQDTVNFNTLAAIEVATNANTLLDKVMKLFSDTPPNKHKYWWNLIHSIAAIISKAQHCYKLPQRKDSIHRELILARKDSLNAVKDAAGLVDKLRRSSLLQNIFLLFDRLYKIQRILVWADEVDDMAWSGTLMQRVSQAYQHVCEMLEVLLIANPSPNQEELGMIIALFSVRQVLSTDPFSYLSDRSVKKPVMEKKEVKQMRADKSWQVSFSDRLSQALKQVGELYPGMRVSLLGGTEPLVFQVQCRGKTNKGMILRLAMMGVDPANQAAIDYLQAHYPDFLGDVYQSVEDIGEFFQAGSCAEFFPGGTLSDFIVAIHQNNKGKCFTRQQQHQFFNHAIQLLTIVMICHDAHIIFPDIKPSNFLFATDPKHNIGARLVVSDLKSLRQLPENQWRTLDVSYTTAYKAPEIQVGDSGMLVEKVDARPHDVYALGVTLWEYLTGSNDLTMAYQPRDKFERVMQEMIQGLTQVDPARRLVFAERVYAEIEVWQRRALVGRVGAAAGKAFSLFQGCLKSKPVGQVSGAEVVNGR